MVNDSTNEDIIKKKLEYIGLNLNNIPENLIEFKSLDYRPSKFIDEKTYKTYKYLNVNEIEIMLTRSK